MQDGVMARTSIYARANAHIPNRHCNDKVELTARGLDKKKMLVAQKVKFKIFLGGKYTYLFYFHM